VHRGVLGSPGAARDWRYRSQVLDASTGVPANISEGFLRYSPRDFARFLDYGLASLAEAERRLHTGIRRGYFTEAECAPVLRLAKRCLVATVRLRRSQKRGS